MNKDEKHYLREFLAAGVFRCSNIVVACDAVKLIGPDNQQFYHVENGKLVPDGK